MSSAQVAPDALPSAADLEAIASLELVDEGGSRVRFGSLYDGHKTIFVFIRHFGCGLCAQYVEQLAQALPPSRLEPTGMKLVVVGCGSWEPIKSYRAENDFPYPVYGDPTRAVYKRLQMVCTLAMSSGPKKSYLKISQGAQIWGSLKKALGSLNHSLTGKTGNYTQNGGELILGPGPVCSHIHRMQNTEDHEEIADLLKAAGIGAPEAVPMATAPAPAAS